MKIITRNELKPSARKTPLYRIECSDILNYDGPCILEDGPESWNWRVLDSEFEKEIKNSDCQFITLQDLMAQPWMAIVERKFNGEITTYSKYVY